MIFDTDILIWYLRGNDKAVDLLVDSMPFSISIVTYIELLQGARNKLEMDKIKKSFAEMGVNIIPISVDISMKAVEFVEAYALNNGMKLADALIAGTCVETKLPLYTANDKHYKMIDGLKIYVFRP